MGTTGTVLCCVAFLYGILSSECFLVMQLWRPPGVRLFCHLQPNEGLQACWFPRFQHVAECEGPAGLVLAAPGLGSGGSSCRRCSCRGGLRRARRPTLLMTHSVLSPPRGWSEQHVDFDRCCGLRSRASESRVGQMQWLPLLPGPGEPRGSRAWGHDPGLCIGGVRGAALWGARVLSGVALCRESGGRPTAVAGPGVP